MSGHTQHSSDHTPVANKKHDGHYQFFLSQNGSVQSYYIQAIFALEVKVGMRKTIPQKKKLGVTYVSVSCYYPKKYFRAYRQMATSKEETLLHQSLG